jgi:hypothetical protein|tara:strand:- start:468 stop:656 length:189 start_codon:yes stop_codon:yes gene_type:complete
VCPLADYVLIINSDEHSQDLEDVVPDDTSPSSTVFYKLRIGFESNFNFFFVFIGDQFTVTVF